MSANVDVQVVAVIMVIRHFVDHAIFVVAVGDEHPVVPAFPRAVPFVFPRSSRVHAGGKSLNCSSARRIRSRRSEFSLSAAMVALPDAVRPI